MIKKKLGFVVCVWFLLSDEYSCFGRYVVEKNSLKVISPDSLKNVYECAIGYFDDDDQYYGGTFTGAVILPEANRKACKPFNTDHHDVGISIIKSLAGGRPIIFLADRGDCYFTLKALNAQNAGATAILIADDRVEPLFVMDTPEEENDPRTGYLQNLTIPSALISKPLGDGIKKALAYNETVTVSLIFERRNSSLSSDERADHQYELWTNNNNVEV